MNIEKLGFFFTSEKKPLGKKSSLTLECENIAGYWYPYAKIPVLCLKMSEETTLPPFQLFSYSITGISVLEKSHDLVDSILIFSPKEGLKSSVRSDVQIFSFCLKFCIYISYKYFLNSGSETCASCFYVYLFFC